MELQFTPTSVRVSMRLRLRICFYICTAMIVGSSAFYLAFLSLDAPPDNFPTGIDITIDEGETQKGITQVLEEAGVVRSSFFLQLQLRHYFKDTFIQAGVYRFDTPLSSKGVAEKITNGQNRSPEVTITLPEGFKANDLYDYLPIEYSTDQRRDLTSYEGHLFPDTYFITPGMTLDEILTLLAKEQEEKLKPYELKISESGFTKEQVIILASLIEREAKDSTSKKMVAGILLHRLKIEMPLQVDATFDYVLNKASHELTDDDLEIDSPFNSYNNHGLPPAPIANPGLEAIEAVLEPTQSEYLYYLTGDDGVFHYATTFEQHKENKKRYIK